MLKKEQKNELVSSYKVHGTDTGSTQVQIALMTARINELNEHAKQNPHDYSSKMGLMRLVGQRRRFLRYMKKKDLAAYNEMIKKLGIRG